MKNYHSLATNSLVTISNANKKFAMLTWNRFLYKLKDWIIFFQTLFKYGRQTVRVITYNMKSHFTCSCHSSWGCFYSGPAPAQESQHWPACKHTKQQMNQLYISCRYYLKFNYLKLCLIYYASNVLGIWYIYLRNCIVACITEAFRLPKFK